MPEADPISEVPSPCTGVCQLDSQGVCLGCHRRMNEIAAWGRLTAEQKAEILRRTKVRHAHRDQPQR